jgi:hypothetical protein
LATFTVRQICSLFDRSRIHRPDSAGSGRTRTPQE